MSGLKSRCRGYCSVLPKQLTWRSAIAAICCSLNGLDTISSLAAIGPSAQVAACPNSRSVHFWT
jgi:hypothetical protein